MAKMTKGPGGPGGSLPVNPLAAMVKAALKRREEAKMAKDSDRKKIFGGEIPGYVERNYKPEIQKGYPEDNRNVSLRAGLYEEKNGDVFPTKLLQKLKSEGKVNQFIQEFERKEGIEKKKFKEIEGNKEYEVGKTLSPSTRKIK